MKIILVGFMGAGKSSLGKLLAKNLSLEYVDMDNLIVKKSGRESDSEIFDKDGEAVFRELESAVSKNLQNKDNLVISTGGGIIMNKLNMEHLKHNGIVIFLKNSFQTSKGRISKKNPPPLFRDKNKAKKLYQLRLPLYTQYADIIIETDNKQLSDIVKEVIAKINI